MSAPWALSVATVATVATIGWAAVVTAELVTGHCQINIS
jgi:hypothetical protein